MQIKKTWDVLDNDNDVLDNHEDLEAAFAQAKRLKGRVVVSDAEGEILADYRDAENDAP